MAGGRPSLFNTALELENLIDLYFEGLAEDEKTPTITGLALHLGFESRQSVYDYEKRNDEFSYTIKRARLKVENAYEEALLSRNSTGAIFALKNFGWADKQEIDHSSKDGSMSPTPIAFSKGSNE